MNLDTLNPEARTLLEEILTKDPDHLSTEEIKFLRARRDYLKKTQREEFADVLKIEDEEPEQKEAKPMGEYNELLKQAKELGYTGGRIAKVELEKFIADNQNK